MSLFLLEVSTYGIRWKTKQDRSSESWQRQRFNSAGQALPPVLDANGGDSRDQVCRNARRHVLGLFQGRLQAEDVAGLTRKDSQETAQRRPYDGMNEKVGNLNVRVIVLLLWILLAFCYASLAYDYIAASSRDKKLDEYVQYLVVECGDQHRPAKEVRSLVLFKADDLKVRLRPDQVGVTGSGQSLKIALNYEVDINLPVLHRTLYRKDFQHVAVYRNIR
jgi:hypothetical protein